MFVLCPTTSFVQNITSDPPEGFTARNLNTNTSGMFAECYKPGDPVGSAEANGEFCQWDALCVCVSRNVDVENKIAWVSDNVRGVSLCAVELSDISYIRMIDTYRYTSVHRP